MIETPDVSSPLLRYLVERDEQVALKVPRHLLRRVAALIGAEEFRYVTFGLHLDDIDVASGEVLVFTDTRVIRATATGAPVEVEPNRSAGSTVTVTAWNRAGLAAVEVADSDDVWHRSPASLWPPRARLTLTYDGRDPITLPPIGTLTVDDHAALSALVPSLLADLDR